MNLSQKIEFVQDLLYHCGKFEYLSDTRNYELEIIAIKELDIIKSIKDSEILHLYAYNYNWDNGFNIPNAIIENPNCDISTALTLLFIGDNAEYLWCGTSYSKEVSVDQNTQIWLDFLTNLANKLMNGEFKSYGIAFENPLSRVEKYHLEKDLTNKEKEVFFQSVEGKNLDICI